MTVIEYKKYFERLRGEGDFSRLGKVFKTKEKYYFFDTGTGKILECTEIEYSILKQLGEENTLEVKKLEYSLKDIQAAINDIISMVEKENILKATPLEKFEGEHFEDLTQSIPQNMRQVVLEVTENCNLRCDYCIYQNSFSGFRDFSPRSMSEETAIKAIDYILKNSYRDEIYVGFYGGEPLLKFDLIKKCVSYALENRGEKKVTFSMTTNGVLMTEEKAEYFASIPEFSLMFSIDGDEKTHNEHRKLENGRGSFELSLKGFQNALKAYGDRRKMISVSTVVSPPYTKEKFEDMQEFFEQYAKDLNMNCTYVELSENNAPIYTEEERERLENRMPLLAWDKQKTPSDKERSFTYYPQIGAFMGIHTRPICDVPFMWHKFNGCCVPGTRRLYVTTEGKFLACERIGEAPSIGDVEKGFDIEAIKKYYIDEYMQKSLVECQNCWASTLCGICYANCYDANGLNMKKKMACCEEEKYTVEQQLIYYHEILENNPELLEPLNHMIVT